ncbi:MAG: endonuclease/exonuclease/phosphatase family protein [Bacteroidetes bacterium]|nr:MAG: endonuclease/exonuclease/phosphatase family protein [Bacteroidota bacterium]
MDSFRIGTFNLFNLILPDVPYYGRQVCSPDSYERKLGWTAAQLDKMQAEIVGFQEIFHAQALQTLVRRSHVLRDAQYLVAAETGDLPRVGLATTFPIRRHEVISDFPNALKLEDESLLGITSFSRPILKAEVEVRPGLRIVVFVAHLKSKRPALLNGETRDNPVHLARGQARSLIRRAAEATALREVVMTELRDRETPVVLLGDVNDSGLAVTSRILSGEPPHRRFPMDVKQRIWDTLLYHVKDIQARQSFHDFYYSHIHNGHHEALDHIMVSQELVRENPHRVGQVRYVATFNDHLLDETLSEDRQPRWTSDHGQVTATIELAKKDRGHKSE